MSCLEQQVEALCRTIVCCQALRVRGPHEGYRNKITYSLFPSLQSSSLAMAEVNTVASLVDRFRRMGDLPVTPTLPHDFWYEVCVKITRRRECMVKLTLMNRPLQAHDEDVCVPSSSSFDRWRASGEPERLVQHLKDAMQRDGSAIQITSVVCHVAEYGTGRPEACGGGDGEDGFSSGKPSKHDLYIPLGNTADHVIEYTPNEIPFVLSPDSFCEVNHLMETAIFEASVEFLNLQAATDAHRPMKFGAFMTGRDVNSVVKTFEPFYAGGVVAVSTCPRVLADTRRNGIACEETTKDEVWRHLEQLIERRKQLDGQHVLITAGRHGLHPNTVNELVRLSRVGAIDDVLYVSCNVESMIRDIFLFKQAFFVDHCRTFDFFPNTNYVMTVMHLRSIKEGTQKRLVVLPIGPPGAGKSSCGSFLQTALATSVTDKTLKIGNQKQKEWRHRQSKGVVSIARTVDVNLPSVVACRWVERDLLFKTSRDGGASLKECKKELHQALLDACAWRRGCENPDGAAMSVTYLDSTNGSSEARELYIQKAHDDGKQPGNVVSCLEITFSVVVCCDDDDCTRSEVILNEYLRRCTQRVDHPGFPNTDVLAKAKIATILKALDDDGHCEATSKEENRHHSLALHIPVGSSVLWTQYRVSVWVWLFLCCSPHLASILAQAVPWQALALRWGVADIVGSQPPDGKRARE